VHGSSSLAAAEKELKLVFPEGVLQLQRAMCIVKPSAMASLLQIRMEIEAAGFTVLKEKKTTINEERAKDFFRDYKERPSFNSMVADCCSGPCCLMVLCRLEAVAILQQLMGPELTKDAIKLRPNSLRARYGQDGVRNAVHGSDSPKAAAREVRFFFPELGADPVPDDDEVRDFLFRKSAVASMDLKTLSDADGTDFTVDPTLQQLLSRGLMALCQVQPKGLAAVKWLSRWLTENNPNKVPADSNSERGVFNPPERTKRYIEYGVNQDGMPFAVEPPPPKQTKKVIDVDVSEETEEHRIADLRTPPHVIFVAGGPGSGKGTQCTRLCDDFNFVHLSTGDLMRDEVAAETYLGTEIYKHMQAGTLVPDSVTLNLLKKTMVKHQDTNRFLLDGFPRSIEQAKRFEQEIAEVAFVLYFEATPETMAQRIEGRAAAAPGRVDDNPETVKKRLKVFQEQTLPVVDYYRPIGKVRTVNAEQEVDQVNLEAKRFFSCRFLYLLGPPGAPVSAVAKRLQDKYGYSSIDLKVLLDVYAKSGERDAVKVKQALAKGKPVDASIACPLVSAEIYRDMALGVQNFVICNFPQTLMQAQFLEYRIPSTSKTLLLDFTRADAEDLAAPSTMTSDVGIAAFYSKEMQENMLGKLPGLVRIPCSFLGPSSTPPGDADVATDGLDQLVKSTWESVCEKVMPSLTIVLGLPCSGTASLAPMLAGLTPNTHAVDCNQLLDKELERRTDIGIQMHNMLSRGQVVPLSMTLDLLKKVVNLTCSDSLVIENCPLYPDQIEYIASEFRIDRVFYVAGNSGAAKEWREKHLKKISDSERTKAGATFDERAERLEQIATYFSRLGKLERMDVTETPTTQKLERMIEQATMPQFAIIHGLSTEVTPKQAEMLASAYGVGPPLTTESVLEWAKTKLKRTVDRESPSEFFSALKQYADSTSNSLLVLDRYPCTAEDATAFLGHFGDPKIVVNVVCDEEFLDTEYKAAHEDDGEDVPDEEIAEKLQAQRTAHETMMKVFEEKCPASLLPIELKTKTPEDMSGLIRKRLLPHVYVIVAPTGTSDFSGVVADAICTSRKEGRPTKFTAIDAKQLSQKGGHSQSIEDRLHKASFMGGEPDALPIKLWVDLYKEAFAKSANPMGTFLISNFPTPCSVTSSPTIRDQFHMLEPTSTLAGIIRVKLTEAAFRHFCSEDAEDWAAYQIFDEKVYNQIIVQFGLDRICDCALDDTRFMAEAAHKVAAEFRKFQEKQEQAEAP